MKIVNLFNSSNESQKLNEETLAEIIFESVIDDINKKRDEDCNKGTFGTLSCICGSYGMAGAAMLCSSAAMTAGAGIVKMIIPDKIYSIAASNLWESVFVPLETSPNGTLCFKDIHRIFTETEKCSAAVIGCGMRVTEDTKQIVSYMLKNYAKPIILDADGINCLSGHIDILKERPYPTILTPHPGEMARLLGADVSDIQSDRIKIAQSFAKENGCILVLKGVGTIVADGLKLTVNPTGNGCLAKGGSGDVLAGVIGALTAQGIDCFKAAVTGVYLHGYAADECVDEYASSCVSGRDVIEAIKYLM